MMLRDISGRVLGVGSRLIDRYDHIETAEPVDFVDLGIEADWCRDYEPSRRTLLRATLSPADVTPADVFADLGSGKGRIVLAAATHYPFRRVIGVEFLPILTAVAQRNLRSFRRTLRCTDVELVTADVRDWVPPPDLTIAYLFNTVRAHVFDDVIGNLVDLVERRGQPLRLIYVNPVEHERVMATGVAVELPGPSLLRLRLARIPAGWVRVYELRPRRALP
jgi:histone methylation protein DOT1